jgi:hypothetical protein
MADREHASGTRTASRGVPERLGSIVASAAKCFGAAAEMALLTPPAPPDDPSHAQTRRALALTVAAAPGVGMPEPVASGGPGIGAAR